MAFRVKLHRAATKTLEGLPKAAQAEIKDAIQGLEKDPWPDGVYKTHLQGPLSKFVKVRVGNYRIAYRIDKEEVTVMVMVIGDRKEVYRLLMNVAGR